MDERRDLLSMLMPLSRELRRIEEAATARHGLSMWQYAILAVAQRSPDRNQAEIAAELHYSKNRIIADLDHLERHSMLERRPGTDRRANVLHITNLGRQTTTAVQTEIHAHEDELLAALSPTARHAFVTALRQLSERRAQTATASRPAPRRNR